MIQVSIVSFKQKGDLRKTNDFLTFIGKGRYLRKVRRIAELGVQRLKEYTPKDTGLTAESWSYEIEKTKTSAKINWNNSNVNRGISIAMLIQMGHGTKQGVYIEGVDYINPALKPIFEQMGVQIWEDVRNSGK